MKKNKAKRSEKVGPLVSLSACERETDLILKSKKFV
jgi:hypothetical protein